MEIRRVLRGEQTGFAPARPVKSGEKKTETAARPAADRLERARPRARGGGGRGRAGGPAAAAPHF